MDETKSPNYFAWAVVIAAGIIIAHYGIRQYEIYQAKQMLASISATTQQQLANITAQSEQRRKQALAEAEIRREQAEARKQLVMLQAREKRAGDSTGARLSRQCAEWTQMAENIKKSDFALQEKAKYCGQLDAYVKHGTPPRP